MTPPLSVSVAASTFAVSALPPTRSGQELAWIVPLFASIGRFPPVQVEADRAAVVDAGQVAHSPGLTLPAPVLWFPPLSVDPKQAGARR